MPMPASPDMYGSTTLSAAAVAAAASNALPPERRIAAPACAACGCAAATMPRNEDTLGRLPSTLVTSLSAGQQTGDRTAHAGGQRARQDRTHAEGHDFVPPPGDHRAESADHDAQAAEI